MSSNEIIAFQCAKCSRSTFPKHSRCPRCKGTSFIEVPLSEGKVVTHTRLTATRPGFAKEIQFAVVEFSNGVRVLGQVEGGEVRSGMQMKVTTGKLSEKDGKISTGFKFTASG